MGHIGTSSELHLDIEAMKATIEEVLDLWKDRSPEGKGLLDRVHFESMELVQILEFLSGRPSREVRSVRSHVSVPDIEKVRALERLQGLMSSLTGSMTISIEGGSDRVRIAVNGVVRDHGRREAPRFALDILRRRISVRAKDGGTTVTCPMCASVIEPQKGRLWGLWCPTCNVRLVIG